MSDIRPFRGYRPRPDLAEKVASPPYDVLSSDEARAMAAGNPLSFLHVVKAEIDLDPGVETHSEPVYAKSAENYRRLIADGVLVRDEKSSFYLYQLTMQGHAQTGLVVGCSVEEYVAGRIKKHEHTRRDKEDDRARHVEELMANAGPVLFTYRQRHEIQALVDGLKAENEPACDFAAADGVRHALWVVDAAADVAALQGAFAPLDALYVADGHHRTASAQRVRDILKAKNPAHTGEEPYNHFLAVLFPDDELRLMGYHRVVKDLNGLAPADFLAAVGERFDLERTDTPEPPGQKRWGMYLDGEWYRLAARAGGYPADDPVRSLDAAILQESLLAPVLGIGDPRTDPRIDFVGGIRGAAELERRCREDMRVAFAFAPVSVSQLMAIADAGAVMPPKSTWFEPKLRSGLVVRSLAD
ncbi:MAG: DUF1015 domain-containing protein [Candidatus Krumholzibacteriota bacterium]|nr:DUF1015 domain-containing protein [Candidatus Krumholzibacteriota bacterium]